MEVIHTMSGTGEKVKTFTYPNMTAKVHIPELTTEERARQMKAVHNAAEQLLKSKIRSTRNEKEK